MVLGRIMYKLGIVRKKDISVHIQRAREQQKKFDDALKDEELRDQKERMDTEHNFDIQEKQAEIDMKAREIKDMKNEVKKAREVYYYCWAQVKSNKKVSADISHQGKKLRDAAAEIYAAIERIKDESNEHNVAMNSMDNTNRDKLKIENKD